MANVAAMDEALKIFNPKSGVVTKEKEEGTTIFELESRARNYLIAKGIEPSIRDSAFVDWSVNNVKTAITKGEVVSVLCDGFYLYNGNGNLASKEKIPGHWMVITDVTENGDYIVSSWAGRYLLKPSEINNLEYISINIK